ncbi:MAG: glycosyltransferase family 2 protein [Thermoanaerobaculia bacterium]|nr:glycosyltransferase family 2 protein [Thermoanaerobaculia bacterium]
MKHGISVVTPTLGRPDEISGLVENLSAQTRLPSQVIVVDGADPEDQRTQLVCEGLAETPFELCYIRASGGTAVQRNVGIEAAKGEYIAFIDDDIRLEPNFLALITEYLSRPSESDVGGVAGYITNQHLDPDLSPRWRLNRRLRLFSTYEPGRFDWATGYPINRYLQPPHDTVREIDFMGAGCAVWRAQVFSDGLRFSRFFTGYGILEDAHLALRAGKKWRLMEDGRAHCIHLRSPSSRAGSREISRKGVLNYHYVFRDLIPNPSAKQVARFWLVQFVGLTYNLAAIVRRPGRETLYSAAGKLEGILEALVFNRFGWKHGS